MNDDMNFKLSKPISVSKDGQFEETHEFILTAPSMKDRKAVGNLQQFIARAEKQEQLNLMSSVNAETIEDIQKMLDPAEVERLKIEKEDDNSGLAIKETILSSNEDIEEFYKCFDTLAKRVCSVLDGVELTQGHIDMMTPKDYDKMCFGYIANFIQ